MRRLILKSMLWTAAAIFVLSAATIALAQERAIYGDTDGSGLASRNLLAFDGTSRTVTGAFGNGVSLIRLVCTTACYVAIAPTGSNALIATAATGLYLPANVPENFAASTGETIAVIQVSSGGNLIVHELTR